MVQVASPLGRKVSAGGEGTDQIRTEIGLAPGLAPDLWFTRAYGGGQMKHVFRVSSMVLYFKQGYGQNYPSSAQQSAEVICEALTPIVTVFGDQALKEVTKVNEVIRAGP